MKKTLLSIGMGIVLSVGVYSHLTKSENMTESLIAVNVEALTQSNEIDIKDCDNGCSTNNKRNYCCKLLGLPLYRNP